MLPYSFAPFESLHAPLLHPSALKQFLTFLSILATELLRLRFSQTILVTNNLSIFLREGVAIVGSAFNSVIRVLMDCNWV